MDSDDRKALKRRYRETRPPMGVYIVRNLHNGKVFIGGSRNLTGKLNSIRFQLEHGSCVIRELQEDFRTWGPSAFEFGVLDTLEPGPDPAGDCAGDLEVLEQMWLEKLRPYGDAGYNRKPRNR